MMHTEANSFGIATQDVGVYPKAVVALSGARDYYQMPLALHEGGLLQALVTEMYWAADRKWLPLKSLLPQALIASRSCPGLNGAQVKVPLAALCASAMMKAAGSPRLNRYKDKVLSLEAWRIATRDNSALFCYSYYASEAFKHQTPLPERRFIFQLHPHPKSVRSLLLDEINRVPQAKSSLSLEQELSLSENEFEELADEPHLANGWVVASSFTASTLAEQGIPRRQIHVVPYGVDHDAFALRDRAPRDEQRFTVIYVGSLVQRKGLSYLLDAVRLIKSRSIRVELCGRGPIDHYLLEQYSDLDLRINRGLRRAELVRRIHEADALVLPSLAEGFGHVILEAMSCGVPVIATPHTCAPDVVMDGVHGFVVPIRDAEAIADRLSWGIDNRGELGVMGESAAVQARRFTWQRFRIGVREAYKGMLASVQLAQQHKTDETTR